MDVDFDIDTLPEKKKAIYRYRYHDRPDIPLPNGRCNFTSSFPASANVLYRRMSGMPLCN